MVELMVVLAVVVILLLVAVPSFGKFIDRSRVKGAADAIVNVIGSARTASVQRNRDVAISFGGSSPAWCVGANGAIDPMPGNAASTASPCVCTSVTSCIVGDQQLALSSSDYNSVTMGSQPSSFILDGRLGTLQGPPSPLPSVTLTSPAGTYKLTVNVAALGQPSVCVPSGSPDIAGYLSC